MSHQIKSSLRFSFQLTVLILAQLTAVGNVDSLSRIPHNPATGPEHAFLHDMDRVKYTTISDEEAIEALFLLSRHEGIIPAIESSHALAHAIKIARTGMTGSVLVNLSGRGDKDLDFVVENYGYGPEFLAKMAEK